jgi:hypothetical protein
MSIPVLVKLDLDQIFKKVEEKCPAVKGAAAEGPEYSGFSIEKKASRSG